MTAAGCYARKPLGYRNGIPIFSREDAYVRNYEQISADHMASFEKKGTNPWMEERLWVELEESTASLLRAHAHSGDRILDVGVGLGRLLARFPDLQRYGLDISWQYLEHTAQQGIEVCFSRIEDMPFHPEFFDLVTCTDVLEHVLDLNLSVSRMLEVLKPGGILVVRVPYREDMAQYLKPGFPYHFVHLRNFDEHVLTLLFTRCFDCEVLKTGYAGHAPLARPPKFSLPIPRWDLVAHYITTATRYLSKGLYDRLGRLLYHPTTINVVVRKGGIPKP